MSTETAEAIEPYSLVRVDIFVPSLIPSILNRLIEGEAIFEQSKSTITLDSSGVVLVDGVPTNLKVILSKHESRSHNLEDVDDTVAAQYNLISL